MTADEAVADDASRERGERVLAVRDLEVRFRTGSGLARAVNGLSYDLHAGETLAVVGESGSGKSVSTMALLGLLPSPPAEVSGQVWLGDEELLQASSERMREIRGNDIAMIFQDPMTSLNPVLTVGRQITEAVQAHRDDDDAAARSRALELLELVGMPSPERHLDSYPHQFSGGMRQRVMIAIALACDPRVLIADEATTALDVTIQAQIVELVERLQRETGTGVIWITHDLGVAAGIAHRVLVMYGGRVVEEAPVDELYRNPRHPYTRGLLASLPVLQADDGGDGDGDRREQLTAIPGLPPDPTDLPPGCPFWPRCTYRLDERCAHEVPPLRDVGGEGADRHRVRTFYDPDADSPEEASRG